MKKRLVICCALAMSLLAGCAMTSPKDEAFQREFQEDWDASMEELQNDWKEDGEKKRYWKILDASGEEAGTVTDQEQVEALDDLLSDDENWVRLDGNPGDGAYSYIYCQQKTRKAGQTEEDREYQELMRFTVSGSEDAVTMEILADLPEVAQVDVEDLLIFTMGVPEETAEALRDPGQFLK